MRSFPFIARTEGRFHDWPLAAKTILAFWAFYMATVVLRGMIGPEGMSLIRFRGMNALVGIGLSILVYGAIRLIAREGGIRRMAIAAAAAILPASVIMSVITVSWATKIEMAQEQAKITTQEGVAIVQHGKNVRIVQGNGDELQMTLPIEKILADKMPSLIADGTVTWFFLFAAWVTLFIALTEQRRTLAAERRVAEAETAAQAAQIRALRYQVNPHFLFNTLNSLSSLVMSGRSDRAEEMLMALSTFFRTSLSLDPSLDVTLAEEIDLQRLYLDIEKVRFPGRLEVVIDVPDDLAQARVPALILQPVVENAIKYGVSATRDKVTLKIEARRLDGGRMQLDISNQLAASARGASRPAALSPHAGTGLGLSNVCARLDAHFGGRADCRFGPLDGGGYRVSMAIPLEEDD